MKKYLKSIGRNIAETKSETILDFVTDIIFNNETGKLVAFLTNNEDVLEFSVIDNFDDKIYIESKEKFSKIRDLKEVQEIILREIDIIWSHVKTESGHLLWICEDLTFDEEEWILKAIHIDKNIIWLITIDKYDICFENIVKIEKDNIVVKDLAEWLVCIAK